jgi:predicted enzyme related to lactoylglutathione lyase
MSTSTATTSTPTTSTQASSTPSAEATPPYGSIGWFEVGSAAPDRAQEFYGGLFGWTFNAAPIAGFDYRDVTTGPGHPLRGGLLGTEGKAPAYAVFVVMVEDVAATCAEAERRGGRVDMGPVTADNGLCFAYLSDLDGNRFGVFSPPSGDASDGAGQAG